MTQLIFLIAFIYSAEDANSTQTLHVGINSPTTENAFTETTNIYCGKKRGETGEAPPVSPCFFPRALSLALFFARAPLSESLEQAWKMRTISVGYLRFIAKV